MAEQLKQRDNAWLAQNTYVDSRSKKRTLNKVGRVDLAHEEGFSTYSVDVVQLPTKENGNEAVVKAIVQTKRGSFTGLGYAKGSHEGKEPLPMAEARALNRALDIALNYGRSADSDIVALDADDPAPPASLGQASESAQRPAEDHPKESPPTSSAPAAEGVDSTMRGLIQELSKLERTTVPVIVNALKHSAGLGQHDLITDADPQAKQKMIDGLEARIAKAKTEAA